jgi:hypothetical protein
LRISALGGMAMAAGYIWLLHRAHGDGSCGSSSKVSETSKALRGGLTSAWGADVITLNQARERALEYRRMAKTGLNPRFNARREIPTFEEVAGRVHIDRMPPWKNGNHAVDTAAYAA